jgi:hypothetical protein
MAATALAKADIGVNKSVQGRAASGHGAIVVVRCTKNRAYAAILTLYVQAVPELLV